VAAGIGIAVDLLPQDIRVPCMSIGLSQDVGDDVDECHVRSRPPRNVPGCVKVKRINGGVGVPAHSEVALGDLGAGLAGGRPYVGVVFGVLVPPRHVLQERSTEDLTEVLGLAHKQVLDQAAEVRACPGQGSTDVIFTQAVQLPQHRLACPAQLVV
jgi:hypothetical protein